MDETLAGDIPSRMWRDLSDEPGRGQLSPAAWRFFRQVVCIWNSPEEQALRLLDLVPEKNQANFETNTRINRPLSYVWTDVRTSACRRSATRDGVGRQTG